MGFFRIDDIFAALLLCLTMFRRLETLSTTKEANPHVSEADFSRWKQAALSGYNLAALVCALKVVLSAAWFHWLASSSGALRVGGLMIFLGWLLGMVAAWHKLTEAGALKKRLTD